MDIDILARSFGRALRAQRKERRLTQEQLALTAGVQRNFISELELGQKQPSLLTVFKLAPVLHITPAELVRLTSETLTVQPGHSDAGPNDRPALTPAAPEENATQKGGVK